MNRRKLFKILGAGVGSLPLMAYGRNYNGELPPKHPNDLFEQWEGKFSEAIVNDEAFWQSFAVDFYDISPDFINLENGYFGVQPIPVNAAYHQFVDKVNRESSRYMRMEYWNDWQMVMDSLAGFTGASKEELLVTRNATEALNILINGFPLKAGDEVILQHHDYHSMIEAFQMLEKRKGIKLKFIDVPLLPKSDDEVVKLYESAISPVTTLILVTHLTHLTGQVLPVKKICEMARNKGVEVMVDAAHSFAHLDYKLADLGADMVGVNLHKWYANPLGAGLLYVKKEKINKLSPMFGDFTQAADSINKLGHFGTLASPALLTIPVAGKFNNLVTIKVKQARLHYLKAYWTLKAAAMKRVEVHTPLAPGQSGAIAAFSVAGISADDTVKRLLDEYGVFTVKRQLKDREVVRVTPNLYNSVADLDRLLEGIEGLSRG
ncbi:aminotransferase class V-fold PLP-dependent enzyme [uncultured Imperialibacter sp.]|uniref:aminotransferase class V-fold PLP-dependent enzyme n=1 Tax=uncultured Imperialibacter sp. TaxID=1672639 RepID=UPI0030D7DE95|tara:strand:+ start:32870 stop:34171 length:1302 start_codon:yes stop_codon:yes gene_type:complete